VQDGQQHDGDRLAEVQGARRLLEDLVRVPQVGVEVRAPYIMAPTETMTAGFTS
jgi:hypothetical protein